MVQLRPVVLLLVEFYPKFRMRFRIKSLAAIGSFVDKYLNLSLIYPYDLIQRPETSQLCRKSHIQNRIQLRVTELLDASVPKEDGTQASFTHQARAPTPSTPVPRTRRTSRASSPSLRAPVAPTQTTCSGWPRAWTSWESPTTTCVLWWRRCSRS